MASRTNKSQNRRRIRKKNQGREAKRIRRNKGSTPAFSVHTPEADKNAPNQAKRQPKEAE
jgi:hypothetical protein